MLLDEIMLELEQMGTEQTKKTFLRHGAVEPLFGVKIGDMKKLVKYIRKDHQLALDLFATNNSDAMYLAGLAIDPKKMSKEVLKKWIKQASWYMIAECPVASVAAESKFALELAREWLYSEQAITRCAGWNTYTNYLSITPDDQLDYIEVQKLLTKAGDTIHQEENRVRYNMNNFIIGVGTFVGSLHGDARIIAEKVGKVSVNLGDTACKVPLATSYLEKIEATDRIGYKKKSCRC